jgi:hypothetical protein
MKQAYLECGKIVGTHGVRGEVRIESYCDTPEVITKLPTLLFRDGAGNFTARKVTRAFVGRGQAVVALEGVSDMDAAILAARQARTPQEAAAACATVDKLIYDYAIWLPGWMENRANIAAWQHVHLPAPYHGPYDVAESHQLWIAAP